MNMEVPNWAEYISSNFGLQYDYTVFVITAWGRLMEKGT